MRIEPYSRIRTKFTIREDFPTKAQVTEGCVMTDIENGNSGIILGDPVPWFGAPLIAGAPSICRSPLAAGSC